MYRITWTLPGIGVVVDPGAVTVRVVGEDSPVSRVSQALLYQMSVAVREVEVGGDLRVVVAPKVVAQLVSEAEVAECAGLGDDLEQGF